MSFLLLLLLLLLPLPLPMLLLLLLLLLLREKVKKAELKAAGQYLTPAQKAAKLRADAMLEAMRAQVSCHFTIALVEPSKSLGCWLP